MEWILDGKAMWKATGNSNNFRPKEYGVHTDVGSRKLVLYGGLLDYGIYNFDWDQLNLTTQHGIELIRNGYSPGLSTPEFPVANLRFTFRNGSYIIMEIKHTGTEINSGPRMINIVDTGKQYVSEGEVITHAYTLTDFGINAASGSNTTSFGNIIL
jgi:hypothetical protein